YANGTRNSSRGAPSDSSDGGAATPSAATSDGGVSVAAAIAINLARTFSRAIVADGLTIIAGERFEQKTSAHTNAIAIADGSAVQPSEGTGGGVSVGAGVAINYARVRNEAILPAGTTVTADGAAVEATMGEEEDRPLQEGLEGEEEEEIGLPVVPEGEAHHFQAIATSGAGGGSVGVAGSVAINIVNIETTARIAGTLNAGGGDVEIKAESESDSETKALPANGGASGVSSVGVGASVAVAVIDDTTIAELTGTLNGGHDLDLEADTEHESMTLARTGASGGDVGVAPGVAITLSNITTL